VLHRILLAVWTSLRHRRHVRSDDFADAGHAWMRVAVSAC
jgi:hypothetical protein